MSARILVVGGAGAVGRLVATWFAPLGDVVAVDPRGGDGVLPAEVTDPKLNAELAAADVVVLAVPEAVALAALPTLLRTLRPGALLVDTLSVKGRWVDAVRRHGAAAAGLEVLGLNPMFAPSLDPAGRPVAVVTVHDGPAARRAREQVVRAGARVVPVSAEEHDRLAAATQALTHASVLAFGMALGEMGVDLDVVAEIAPPPHLTLLGLLARITGGVPEVYWDVQAANPHAAAAREALARSARALADLLDPDAPGAEKSFTELLVETRAVLGRRQRGLAELCARTFARLTTA